MRALGIEGTAWSLSVAVVDEEDVITIAENPYIPKEGGIHPREASQHHSEHIAELIASVFSKVKPNEIDIVAANEMEKKILFTDVKINKKKLNLHILEIKSQKLLKQFKFKDWAVEYTGLSIEDM